MIAFSRVPPMEQKRSQNIHIQFPLESVITVDAINQAHQKRKTHIVSNPNQLVGLKKDTLQIVNNHEINNKVLDKLQNVVPEILNQKDKISTFNKEEIVNEQSQKNTQLSKQLQLQNNIQIPVSNQLSIIKHQSNQQDQAKLAFQSYRQSNTQQQFTEQKFRELTHIVFFPSSQKTATILHKNPIFHKTLPNQQPNFVQSVVKENQQQFREDIVENKDYSNVQSQENVTSHIQCTLFGNSKSNAYPTDPYELHQPNNIISIRLRQKSKSTFDKVSRETSDKELYQSYHRNKNKVKHLGGSKFSTVKNQSKLNLKPVKLQITKIRSLSPVIF